MLSNVTEGADALLQVVLMGQPQLRHTLARPDLDQLRQRVLAAYHLAAGGAKVEDKLGVLRNLGGKADTVLVGGKMAEELREGSPLGFPVELPSDVVAAAAFEEDADAKVVPSTKVALKLPLTDLPAASGALNCSRPRANSGKVVRGSFKTLRLMTPR